MVKKSQGKDNNVLSEKPAVKNAPGKDRNGNPIANIFGKAADLAVGAKVRKVTINSLFLIKVDVETVIDGHFSDYIYG